MSVFLRQKAPFAVVRMSALFIRLIRIKVTNQACQLLVALAEEGWVDGEVARLSVERYLRSLCAKAGSWPAAIVLRCTHFPLLKPIIQEVAQAMLSDAAAIHVIDSSQAVAGQFTSLMA